MKYKLLFARGPLRGFRVFVLAVLSVVLMMLDQTSPRFHQFRDKAAIIVYPLQWVVDAPIRGVNWVSNVLFRHAQLLSENKDLQREILLLQAALQKSFLLEKENAQLLTLLKSAKDVKGRYRVAPIMAVSLDPTLHQVILRAGSAQGVYVGQPVLDGFGVFGRVVGVSKLTSKVMLLTDQHAAVPVENYRSGVRGIVLGTNQANLKLIDQPVDADVKVGDRLISSGLAQHYPVGYTVGVVSHIAPSVDGRFLRVVVQPTAKLKRSRQVLVVWPSDKSVAVDVKRSLLAPLMKALNGPSKKTQERAHAK